MFTTNIRQWRRKSPPLFAFYFPLITARKSLFYLLLNIRRLILIYSYRIENCIKNVFFQASFSTLVTLKLFPNIHRFHITVCTSVQNNSKQFKGITPSLNVGQNSTHAQIISPFSFLDIDVKVEKQLHCINVYFSPE